MKRLDPAFERLLESLTDGFWVWDLKNPDDEYMSPRFWRTFGYDPDKMPHSPSAWKSLIHPDDEATAVAAFGPHVYQGAPYHLLVRYRHADGHWAWTVCRGQVHYDENGAPDYMLGCHQDVTELGKQPSAKEKAEELIARVDRLAQWIDD